MNKTYVGPWQRIYHFKLIEDTVSNFNIDRNFYISYFNSFLFFIGDKNQISFNDKFNIKQIIKYM